MFTKLLIFALLGTSFVLANPINQEYEIEDVDFRGWTDQISGWWNNLKDIIKDSYQEWKKTFEESFNELVGTGSHLIEIAKGKYEELKQKYNELKQDAKNALDQERIKWEQRIKEAYTQGKQKYEEVKQQASKALDEVKVEWEHRLDEWKIQLEQAVAEAEKQYEEAKLAAEKQN